MGKVEVEVEVEVDGKVTGTLEKSAPGETYQAHYANQFSNPNRLCLDQVSPQVPL